MGSCARSYCLRLLDDSLATIRAKKLRGVWISSVAPTTTIRQQPSLWPSRPLASWKSLRGLSHARTKPIGRGLHLLQYVSDRVNGADPNIERYSPERGNSMRQSLGLLAGIGMLFRPALPRFHYTMSLSTLRTRHTYCPQSAPPPPPPPPPLLPPPPPPPPLQKQRETRDRSRQNICHGWKQATTFFCYEIGRAVGLKMKNVTSGQTCSWDVDMAHAIPLSEGRHHHPAYHHHRYYHVVIMIIMISILLPTLFSSLLLSFSSPRLP